MQYKKIMSAKASKAKRGVEISFTHAQIGGFLGALLAAVAPPLITGVANLVKKKNFFAGEGMCCKNKKKRGANANGRTKQSLQGNGLFLPGARRERYRG
jgi:hypothetical protein